MECFYCLGLQAQDRENINTKSSTEDQSVIVSTQTNVVSGESEDTGKYGVIYPSKKAKTLQNTLKGLYSTTYSNISKSSTLKVNTGVHNTSITKLVQNKTMKIDKTLKRTTSTHSYKPNENPKDILNAYESFESFTTANSFIYKSYRT